MTYTVTYVFSFDPLTEGEAAAEFHKRNPDFAMHDYTTGTSFIKTDVFHADFITKMEGENNGQT